jgi:uncharacterized protein YndB with AHSA1/START domain
MWEFEHSVQASASRERIWALWTDVSGWPSWNPGVGYAELDGPVIEGATGTVRAVGGPTSTLKVLAIEPERRFVTETSERLMRLRFEHERRVSPWYGRGYGMGTGVTPSDPE